VALLNRHLVLGDGADGLAVARALASALVPADRVDDAVAVCPVDPTGIAGWDVSLTDGTHRRYAGVVLVPGAPDERPWSAGLDRFAGPVLAAGEPVRRGARVLVTGAPAPAASAALTLARRGARPHVAVAPRDLAACGGSALRALLRTRLVVARGAIAEVQGTRVRFAGGTEGQFDAAVRAVARRVELPWLDPSLVDWHDGVPSLVGGTLVPGLAGLYICARASLPRQARLIAALMAVQPQLDHPVADDLAPAMRPEPLRADGTPDPRELRRLERRVAGWSPAGSRPDALAMTRPLPAAGVA
jgi:hypothetical protein